MISGRDLFKCIKIPLAIAVLFLKILPIPILEFFYAIFSSIPWRLGIGLRYLVLKAGCAAVGDNVCVKRWVVIKDFKKLNIGNNVSIHEYCFVDASGGVSIGNDVSIAHGSSIISFEHSWAEPTVPIKYNELLFKGITIHDDIWIGAGVRILAGAELGSRSVFAANCVVKGICGGGALYAGLPAREIRRI